MKNIISYVIIVCYLIILEKDFQLAIYYWSIIDILIERRNK